MTTECPRTFSEWLDQTDLVGAFASDRARASAARFLRDLRSDPDWPPEDPRDPGSAEFARALVKFIRHRPRGSGHIFEVLGLIAGYVGRSVAEKQMPPDPDAGTQFAVSWYQHLVALVFDQ